MNLLDWMGSCSGLLICTPLAQRTSPESVFILHDNRTNSHTRGANKLLQRMDGTGSVTVSASPELLLAPLNYVIF